MSETAGQCRPIVAAFQERGETSVSVFELDACRLRLRDGQWAFAAANTAVIRANWERARAANPKLFDGEVFIVERWGITEGVLEADVVETRFSAYLYWRDNGFHDGVFDEAFVTTAVMASDGGMLVARAVDGTLNAGHFVSPGGLIDKRDLGPDRLIDPAGAAMRELQEETGLTQAVARRRRGFLMARDVPYLALASVFDVRQTGAELVARVQRYIDEQDEPELLEPRILRRRDELEQVLLTTPTRLIAAHLLD